MLVATQWLPETVRERLSARAPLRVWDEPSRPIPHEMLREWLCDAVGLIASLNERIDASVLEGAGSLRVVANMAVGYDNLDLGALGARSILATNTPDVLTEATAEMAWALILAVARGLVPARDALLQGQWTHWRSDGFLGTELFGKRLGVVGAGRIGQAVARRAAAFGMETVLMDPGPGHHRPAFGTVWPRERVLAESDVISLHVPLTDATRGLVDAAWLRAMKPGSVLVNTSRGGVVEEPALMAALDRGHLAGAGLDVFEREPVDPEHPLVRHPRVLAVPHIGSATWETRARMAALAAENLLAALAGERPPNLIDASLFDSWPYKGKPWTADESSGAG
jgi:glyoxylate reductase